MPATCEKPKCLHREVQPVRECLSCGCYLASANADEVCARCGGWSIQRTTGLAAMDDRAEMFAGLKELMAG